MALFCCDGFSAGKEGPPTAAWQTVVSDSSQFLRQRLRSLEFEFKFVLCVAEGTFEHWFREVKRSVGTEFSRTGLFPPGRYFQSRGSAAAERHVLGSVAVTRAGEKTSQQRNPQIERNVQQILQQR